MADAAAARREARRKRILENSHNRLQLIAGKNNEEIARESTNASPIPPPPYEPDVPTVSSVSSDSSLLNGIIAGLDSVETNELLASLHDVVAAGDGEIANDTAGVSPSLPSEAPQRSPWKAMITLKYDIVLLAFLLQFIHAVASVPFENTYFFLPLLIYSVTKLAWLPKQNSSIANALLLLNGLSPGRLYNMLEILQWAGTISQDVCIFLFTTICIQSLFITLKESFIT